MFACLGEMVRLDWEESVNDVGDVAGDSDEDCADEGGHVNKDEVDNHEENRSESPETVLNKSDSGIETLGGKLFQVLCRDFCQSVNKERQFYKTTLRKLLTIRDIIKLQN